MSLVLAATVADANKHASDVTSLIFKNNKLYSAADDGKIKMWNTDLKFEKEVQAHAVSIYSLTADNGNLIYSCSSDGSIRSWNTDTLEAGNVIKPPGAQEMWKIYWSDDIISVVDDEGVVALYKNGKIYSVVQMMEQIKDIAFKDHLLYTVRDLEVTITEVFDGPNHRSANRITLAGRAPLFLLDDKLCYSSREGRDIIINYRNKVHFEEITRIENAHELMINTISGGKRGSEWFLYTGGWDKNVKEWKIVNGGASPLSVCDLGGYVNAICVNDDCTNVFAAGADGKIWKMNVQ